mgnify:CR=1 FL=1
MFACAAAKEIRQFCFAEPGLLVHRHIMRAEAVLRLVARAQLRLHGLGREARVDERGEQREAAVGGERRAESRPLGLCRGERRLLY